MARLRNRLAPLGALALLLIMATLWEQRQLKGDLRELALVHASDLAHLVQKQVQLARTAESISRETLEDHLFAAAWMGGEHLLTHGIDDLPWASLLSRGGLAYMALFSNNGDLIQASSSDSLLAASIRVKLLKQKLMPVEEIRLGLVGPEEGSHYATAVHIPQLGFVCSAIRSREWKALQKQLGIGRALQDAADQSHLDYALLLTPSEILAAASPLPSWIGTTEDPLALDSLPSRAVVHTLPAALGSGFDCLVPLNQPATLWLRAGLSPKPSRALQQRSQLGLWLRTAGLLILALGVLAWQITRGRNRELEAEGIRITKEVRALESRRALDERTRSLAETAAGVAHELRNPLNTIAMSAQRIQLEFEPREDREEWQSLLSAMRSEGDRMGRIIEDFLSVARPRRVEFHPVDLQELLRDTLRIHQAQFTEHQIQTSLECPGQLMLLADADYLRQALGNLLDNAIRALVSQPQTSRIINVSVKASAAHIDIRVDDSGPGVAPEKRYRIFDLYYTDREEGTGLGLALAQRAALDHGGTIVCDTSPLGGARFCLRMERKPV